MDRYECIKIFIRTAHLGSFTATADEFNQTQSAISKKIAWLESRIGFTLFHRNNRKIHITESGKIYLKHCEKLIDEMNCIEAQIKQELNTVAGHLKISVPSAMATRLLAEPLTLFLEKHPLVTVNISVNDHQIDLIEQDVDIAIRASHVKDSSYKARLLGENPITYFASTNYLEAAPPITSPKDLANHKCITYSLMTPSNTWTFFESSGDKTSIKVKEYVTSDSPELMLKMALLDQGITALPRWMVSEYFVNEQLEEVLSHYQSNGLPMYAIYKADDYQPIRVKAFVDFLAEHLQLDIQKRGNAK
ncbi:LysR family transcriptional regulator [Vibrio penaeicida]|uniref:LysR family transcriptional regulator n=1 Tax=Vibrio penaeicida TaxID=104609 RepID=UPI00273305AA|nr:LysR family transcriptional regulator [Vibrio penaeicida]MDP2571997.1 LysR family transcriptional regulator [Vibrio penaeicida]